jgi:hypothetical protein
MKISKSDYYKLVGLVTLARDYLSKTDDLAKIALEITKEEDFGYTSDIVYGNCDLDEGLKNLGIEVE